MAVRTGSCVYYITDIIVLQVLSNICSAFIKKKKRRRDALILFFFLGALGDLET